MTKGNFTFINDFEPQLVEWEQELLLFETPEVQDFFQKPENKTKIKLFLEHISPVSPYLLSLVFSQKAFLKTLIIQGFDKTFSCLIKSAFKDLYHSDSHLEVMDSLRVLKRKAALLIALADIMGHWHLGYVCQALSVLARTALSIAVSFVLRSAHNKGELALPDMNKPEKDSGFIVLAMGKLGANELNYSSDIDLIILFDAQKTPYVGKRDIGSFFVRLTREIITLFEEKTSQGYVFRTDLRLRPDPGSTPIALSTMAAAYYYESYAQNWERAAFIKARPVAGDKNAGYAFLKEIKPFIWRRSTDFYAIQQIYEIKKSSSSVCGQELNLLGHNIKLGHGGIREIEFYAQMQQLLWAGRDATLRSKATLNALKYLVKAGFVTSQDQQNLSQAYVFLRTLEHRLQMVDDAQTQTLPLSIQQFEKIAFFMGFKNLETFEKALFSHLKTVQNAYNALETEDIETLAHQTPFVFTGTELCAQSEQALKNIGFTKTDLIADAVRGWLSGRYRSLRNEKARTLISELIPLIFKALSQTKSPDTAFTRFDAFLQALPAGVQLFSLFKSRPALLDLLAEVVGSTSVLSAELGAHSDLFDAVLAFDFFQKLKNKHQLATELEIALEQTQDLEEIYNALRRFVREKRFQAGVLFLRNLIDAKTVGGFLSDLVFVVLNALCKVVLDDFEKVYGVIDQATFSFVLMGKAGSQEMNFLSDLDILFVYDANIESISSKGVSASVYYARLAQRLISAITAKTKEGSLWQVDMRLRPSGNAGPVATSFESFQRYYKESAWTWEKMALTKAYVVFGENQKIKDYIKHVFCTPQNVGQLKIDVREMREKIQLQCKDVSVFDLKYGQGGMLDIEFSVQFLQLKEAYLCPDLLQRSVESVLKKALEYNKITKECFDVLVQSYFFMLHFSAQKSLGLEPDIPQDVLDITHQAFLNRLF